MVDTWGESIESKLNRRDAVRFLTECKIGLAKAEKIKAAWDASKGAWDVWSDYGAVWGGSMAQRCQDGQCGDARLQLQQPLHPPRHAALDPAAAGTREGVRFLKEHGVPLPLAQLVAERHGVHTVARVQQDPYAALAGAGLPFRCVAGRAWGETGLPPHADLLCCCTCCAASCLLHCWPTSPCPTPTPPCHCCSKVDLLATKVGAPPDLVSRAAMALQHCLGAAAAEEGHTFLPWHRLEKDGRRLLQAVGLQHGAPWHHAGDLHVVAQLMHSSGVLVAEPPPAAAGRQAAAADEASCEVQQALAPPPPHPIRAHPTFESMTELRHYLNSHLPGAPVQAGA